MLRLRSLGVSYPWAIHKAQEMLHLPESTIERGGGTMEGPRVVVSVQSPHRERLPLLDRVREEIRKRHYSLRTEEAYVAWIRRFVIFHGCRNPEDMGGADVEKFLSHLAVSREVAPSTQNQALGALLFLFRDVLRIRLDWLDGVVRAKKPGRLPVVLTRQEVQALMADRKSVV